MITLVYAVLFLTALGSVHSACTKPSVRREWRSFSKHERTEWIRAVNCLAKLPSEGNFVQTIRPPDIAAYNASGSYYDDFVYIHMDLNHIIHSTGLFLPFHRYYVQVYENALKKKCGYKGVSPYWNWSLDSKDVYGSTLFQDSDPVSGLGGWGDPANDVQVPDGGFAHFKLSYPSPHTLRRNFTIQPFLGADPKIFRDQTRLANTSITPSEVSKVVHGFVGNYSAFQAYFEDPEGAHSSVHLMTGGDLGGTCPSDAPPDCLGGPTFSANEPLFWMHHAMVDKVWYDWQHANPANAHIFSGGSVQASEDEFYQYPTGVAPPTTLNSTLHGNGMFPDATVADVIDTQRGMLCYIYDS